MDCKADFGYYIAHCASDMCVITTSRHTALFCLFHRILLHNGHNWKIKRIGIRIRYDRYADLGCCVMLTEQLSNHKNLTRKDVFKQRTLEALEG